MRIPKPSEDTSPLEMDLTAMGITTAEGDFAAIAESDEFPGRGIQAGDIVLYNRAKQPRHGQLVAVESGGELLLREFVEGEPSGVVAVAVGLVRKIPV